MAEPEHVIREKLAAVFARQDFYEACLRQDAGAMVTIFEAGKVTQGQLAALTGIAQSTLSNYKRGVNTAKFASTFEKLTDGTDMPPRLRQALGLSGDAPARSRPAADAMAGIPADTFDLQLLAEAIGRNGTAVTPRSARPGGAARRRRGGRARRGMGTAGRCPDQAGCPEPDRGPGAGSAVGRVLPDGGDHPGAGRAQGADRTHKRGQHDAQRTARRPGRRAAPTTDRHGGGEQPAGGVVRERPG